MRSFLPVACCLFAAVSTSATLIAADRTDVGKAMFDSTKLLEIEINMEPEDWKQLAAQRRNFAESFTKTVPESPYTYFRADIKINGFELPAVGVRKKGFFGSMDQTRPSLKIKFNEYQKNGTVGGLDRLTLNNNKQDRAHVSQILAYRTFRKAGLPAPRSNLARVTVNGELLGVYGHVESIKKPFLKRTFGEDTGDMYEGVFPCDFFADRIERFEVKNNKKSADRADLKAIAEILNEPGEDLESKLSQYFDIDEFIRHWATEVMIGFWDGYAGNQNNYYLYKSPKDGKYHFVPWGADFAFSSQFQSGPKSIKAKGLMAFHLYQSPKIQRSYRKQLMKLLDEVWDEDLMLEEVERVNRLVRDHLHADQAGLERAVSGTKEFIKNRRREIMEELKDGPVAYTNRPTKPMYYKQVGTIKGAFAGKWTDKPGPPSDSTLDPPEINLTINGKPFTLKGQTAMASPGRPRPSFGGRPGPPGPPPHSLILRLQPVDNTNGFTLFTSISRESFRATKKPISVQGMFTESSDRGAGARRGGFGRDMKMFVGTLRLTNAETNADGKVAGVLEGKLVQMRGSFGGPGRGR